MVMMGMWERVEREERAGGREGRRGGEEGRRDGEREDGEDGEDGGMERMERMGRGTRWKRSGGGKGEIDDDLLWRKFLFL